MKKDFLPFLIACFICSCISFQAYAQEKVFATYFDIPVNSPEGTEVTGRIHLERNKDVLTSPIPKGYKFEIVTACGSTVQDRNPLRFIPAYHGNIER